jgi:Rieske Fe-S protein
MALTENKKILDLDSPKTDPTATRRKFLELGIYAVAAGVGVVVAVPTIGYFIAPATENSGQEVRVTVGKVADYANQLQLKGKSLKDIEYTDSFKKSNITKQVFVRAKVANASKVEDFLVLDSTCTHAGCGVSLKTDKPEPYLYCGCHFSYYDKDGNVTAGPAPKPLHRYTVRIDNDNITINVFQTFS